MNRSAMFVAILASAPFVVDMAAQTQAPPPARQRTPAPRAQAPQMENAVEGRVQRVDASRTEITLSDGTKLIAPADSMLKSGAITEGMRIVASYREENGAKILTGLAVRDRGPATR